MNSEFELIVVQHKREDDLEKNLMRLIKNLRAIKIEKNSIIVLPEVWLTKEILEYSTLKSFLTQLEILSNELGVWMVPGAFYVRENGKALSKSYIISPKGESKAISEKIFPSYPMKERDEISPGSFLKVEDLGFTKIGVIICVDAMYPELSRLLAIRGAELILNPSSIPENRVQLWESISVTRASENTVYWASVILTGTSYPDGRKVLGGSIVVDPGGRIILKSGASEEIVRVTLDKNVLENQRKRWVYLEDVKKSALWEVYKRLDSFIGY
ncbi:MAG: carbon-nitrogen hydrolase family protein [Fervidicoccus fontis]